MCAGRGGYNNARCQELHDRGVGELHDFGTVNSQVVQFSCFLIVDNGRYLPNVVVQTRTLGNKFQSTHHRRFNLRL